MAGVMPSGGSVSSHVPVSVPVSVPVNPSIRRWTVIYPSYFDSTLSVSQGRRLARSFFMAFQNTSAPPPPPLTLDDCVELIQIIQMPYHVEAEKMYSRNPMTVGRIRVQLRHDDGTYINEQCKKKQQLVRLMGQNITKLKGREAQKGLNVIGTEGKREGKKKGRR